MKVMYNGKKKYVSPLPYVFLYCYEILMIQRSITTENIKWKYCFHFTENFLRLTFCFRIAAQSILQSKANLRVPLAMRQLVSVYNCHLRGCHWWFKFRRFFVGRSNSKYLKESRFGWLRSVFWLVYLFSRIVNVNLLTVCYQVSLSFFFLWNMIL